MREAFAGVLGGLQSLGHDDACERPVDRLGALGTAARTGPDEDLNGNLVARSSDALRQAKLASLGVDLVAFKDARRALSQVDAIRALAEILLWTTWWTGRKVGINEHQAVKVAGWAVREWAEDRCQPRPNGCGGAREVPSAAAEQDGRQPTMICSQCHGSGRRRWTDEERTNAMGEAFAVPMSHAHRIMAFAESLALRRGMELVERWPR